MDAKRPNGKGSSWGGCPRILVFCFLSMMFLPGVIGEAFASATITVKLAIISGPSNLVLISVRTVEAETGKSLASVSLKRQSSQVRLKVKAVPQIVFADLVLSDGNTLSGYSHVLRPVDRKNMAVTLPLNSETSAAFSETTNLSDGLFSPSPDTTGPPADIALVGVPSSGFTVEGINLSTRDITRMLTTDLTNTPCYDQTGGYAVVLTDPEDLAIVKAEIDFSNSTWADPSTRLQDLHVPPSYFIHGSWVSDGTTVTVTYRLVDPEGNELLSKSDTGPVDNLLDIHTGVAKDLTKGMCCNKSKKVKCAKTGSIDINFAFEQSNQYVTCTFSEVGAIQFSLQSANADPNNACEYSGEGTASLGIDCSGYCSTVCSVAIDAAGKVVSQSGFPCTGARLMFDFSNAFSCSNNLCWGSTTIPESEVFPYQNGAVVRWPGIQGGYTLHLK